MLGTILDAVCKAVSRQTEMFVLMEVVSELGVGVESGRTMKRENAYKCPYDHQRAVQPHGLGIQKSARRVD